MPNSFAMALIVALTASPGAAAQQSAQDVSPTTRLVPFSGILADAASTPLTGAQTVTFTLFDAAENGTPLWTEIQTVSADARGQYAAYLGSSVALPLDIFRAEQARWLEVSVNGRAQPRTMLVAVPYALKAMDAETLGGRPADRFLVAGADGRLQTAGGAELIGPAADGTGIPNQLTKWVGTTTLGSSILTESAANQIGIGTNDPTEGGTIDSKVTIRATDGLTALAVSNQIGTPRFALNINADGSWITYDRAMGSYAPGIAQRGGRVGIATTDPTGGGVVDSKFTVRNLDNNTGIAVLNQGNARRFALNTGSDGSWVMYDGYNGAWRRGIVQRNGNLAVGPTAPAAKLDVEATSVEGIASAQQTAGLHALRTVAPSTSISILGIASDNISDVFGGTVGVEGYTNVDGGVGVWGSAASGLGVRGTTSTGTAVTGQSFGAGLAGNFIGNVTVSGTLSKGGGAFQIDHPLDPANKYLLHSFVESPDMMNVYNGNVVLDAQGEATVTLPDWFEALNRDFRYQLTAIGAPGPNLYVARKISDNQFKIAGGTAGAEVSWQVTGIRQDAWANANRIPVEKDKAESERGRYLHPEAHGLSREMGIEPPDVTVVTKKRPQR
jgi:hypothetical protein